MKKANLLSLACILLLVGCSHIKVKNNNRSIATSYTYTKPAYSYNRADPLFYAIERSDKAKVTELLKSFYSNKRVTYTQPLSVAIHNQNIEMVQFFIDKGVDVNGVDIGFFYNYETMLQIAMSYGNFEIVKLLVSNGAGVNTRIPVLGDLPLGLAEENLKNFSKTLENYKKEEEKCWQKEAEIIKGSAVYRSDRNENFRKQILKGNMNESFDLKLNSLRKELEKCSDKIEYYFSELGPANGKDLINFFPNISSSKEQTSGEIIRGSLKRYQHLIKEHKIGNYKKIITFLKEQGAHNKPNTNGEELFDAVGDGDVSKVKDYIEKGVFIDSGVYGNTALGLALLMGRNDILEIILKAKPNLNLAVNWRDDNMFAYFQYILFFEKNWEAASLLIKYGYEPDLSEEKWAELEKKGVVR